MSNGWIITNHKFVVHGSELRARAEMERLSKAMPDKQFRIMRVKNSAVAFAKPADETVNAVVPAADSEVA